MNRKHIILIILSILAIIFFNNNYFLYEKPILKVTSVTNENILDSEKITQTISGIIQNGEYAGNEYTIINEISESLVYSDKINVNDNLFVNINSNEEITNYNFEIKRDNYLAFLIILFIDLLIIVGGFKGFKTLLSFILNFSLLISCTFLYIKFSFYFNILFMYLILTPILISLSILIPNGFNEKSYSAIISSIASTFICFALSYILLYFFDGGLYYYTMDYVDVVNDYKGVFYVSILLSGLGAIMDIAITISSALSEIINKNKNITDEKLKISCQNISKDIMSTMINVLLFTCFISVIPTIIFVIRNNMSLYNAIDIYGQIQLIIILTSCIGIILSIPISEYISLYMLKRSKS